MLAWLAPSPVVSPGVTLLRDRRHAKSIWFAMLWDLLFYSPHPRLSNISHIFVCKMCGNGGTPLLLQNNQRRVLIHTLAGDGFDGFDDACTHGAQLVFHFHGLKDHDRLAFVDRFAFGD